MKTSKHLVRSIFGGFLMLLVLFSIRSYVRSSLMFVMLLLLVWMYSDFSITNSFQRLTNYKKNKIRLVLSIFLLLLYIFTLIVTASIKKEEAIRIQNEIERQKYLDSLPIPTIYIDEKEIDLGTGMSYVLQLYTEDADNVSINGKHLEKQNNLYTYEVNFTDDQTQKNLTFIAWNESKSSEIDVILTRDHTEDRYKKREEEKRQKEEAAEAERIKNQKEQEERERLQREREAKQDRINNRYERWLKSGKYMFELENDLFNRGFKEVDSGFEKSPDGSTQIATYYEGLDEECLVSVMLQYAYASGRYWYNVTVECF